jgi:CDP-diglyceride synthetase
MSTALAHVDWGWVPKGVAFYAFVLILFRIFRKKANSAPLTDFIAGFVFVACGIPALVLFHASPVLLEVLAMVWISEIVASLFGILWSRRTPRRTPPAGTDQTPQLDSPR